MSLLDCMVTLRESVRNDNMSLCMGLLHPNVWDFAGLCWNQVSRTSSTLTHPGWDHCNVRGIGVAGTDYRAWSVPQDVDRVIGRAYQHLCYSCGCAGSRFFTFSYLTSHTMIPILSTAHQPSTQPTAVRCHQTFWWLHLEVTADACKQKIIYYPCIFFCL